MTHTPRYLKNGVVLTSEDGKKIEVPCMNHMSYGECEDHVNFVFKAVNAHYSLLDQLKKSTHQLRMRRDRTDSENKTIVLADKAIALAEKGTP